MFLPAFRDDRRAAPFRLRFFAKIGASCVSTSLRASTFSVLSHRTMFSNVLLKPFDGSISVHRTCKDVHRNVHGKLGVDRLCLWPATRRPSKALQHKPTECGATSVAANQQRNRSPNLSPRGDIFQVAAKFKLMSSLQRHQLRRPC